MNILYIINYAGTGGTETYVEALAARKRPVDTIHFIYNKDAGLCERMRSLGIRPVRIKMRFPLDLWAAREIADYCRVHDIDIIHTQFQRENYISVLAKFMYRHVRVVFTSHIIIKNNVLWKLLNRALGRGDDAVIAVCSMGAGLLLENHMPADRIRIVYNGVDFEEDIVRHRLAGPFTFITITRFTEEKGIPFLLEAIANLKSLSNDPFKMVIVGDGPMFNQSVTMAQKLNISKYISFLGYRTDTDKLLEEADVFVNSSRSEMLSFAILEAMSKGLPVLATDVGGNPDIIAHSGCGTLVEYGDARNMARAMLALMHDSETLETYSENARIAVRNVFSRDVMVKKTYEVYEDVRRKDK